MNISEHGLMLIEQFEGFTSHSFLDTIAKPPVWTVGFGETHGVTSKTTVTRAQATVMLKKHIDADYSPAVNALKAQINQNQFDALVSLCYNCGPGAMQWQIGKDVKAGKMAAAAGDFMRYVYAGGVRIQGLVNRRKAEQNLFLTPSAPPDPFWYLERSVFIINGLKLIEYNTVVELHNRLKNPKVNTQRIGLLKYHASLLRQRVWSVSHNPLVDGHPTWNLYHRGSRWQTLNAAASGHV
jgi:GH24 family phage-related lysozyme (muramidase)